MNGMKAEPFNAEYMLVKALKAEVDEQVCGFYYFDIEANTHTIMTQLGDFLANPYTICRNSGIKDKKDNYIFEYDLLKLTHGLLPECYGFLVWEEEYKAWKIRQFTEFGGCIDVNKYIIESVGNIILNDADAEIIYKQDKEEKEREVTIDTSYCPSCFKK